MTVLLEFENKEICTLTANFLKKIVGGKHSKQDARKCADLTQKRNSERHQHRWSRGSGISFHPKNAFSSNPQPIGSVPCLPHLQLNIMRGEYISEFRL